MHLIWRQELIREYNFIQRAECTTKVLSKVACRQCEIVEKNEGIIIYDSLRDPDQNKGGSQTEVAKGKFESLAIVHCLWLFCTKMFERQQWCDASNGMTLEMKAANLLKNSNVYTVCEFAAQSMKLILGEYFKIISFTIVNH